MATHKTKRSIHLTQPNPSPAEMMPVRAHVYRTIADVNGGFEQVTAGLQTLERISFLPSASLNQMHNAICRIRAQANLELMTLLKQREAANAGHFQRLCIGSEKGTGEAAAL